MVKIENGAEILCHHKLGAENSIRNKIIIDIIVVSTKYFKGNFTSSKVSESRELIRRPGFSIIHEGKIFVEQSKEKFYGWTHKCYPIQGRNVFLEIEFLEDISDK